MASDASNGDGALASGEDALDRTADLPASVDGIPPSPGNVSLEESAFDFDAHRQQAVDSYQVLQREYEDCAQAVCSVLETALGGEGIRIHSIEARAKATDSFGRKASSPSRDDPGQPKYPDPLTDITDLSGVRVITFLLDTVDKVNQVIEREFEVLEKSAKSGLLEEQQKLGYQSVHFLVRFSPTRRALPEYARFEDRVTEIQVRTILQHAWAEIEHDIQYKAVETIPSSIRRRFTSLAGLVEIADREFQAISNDDERGRSDARRLISQGQLDRVEVTPDALRTYLDDKYGPDGRMSEWSYGWVARLLKRLGFETLGQVDVCIEPYDDDRISRLLWGSRQGQLTRFEDVLLAAMGDEFIRRHHWYGEPGMGSFEERSRRFLAELGEAGIDVGDYRPGSR